MKPDCCRGLYPLLLTLLLTLLPAVGCGGDDDGDLRSTSNDEIADFIEQNPEFAAPQGSSSTSNQELGLE